MGRNGLDLPSTVRDKHARGESSARLCLLVLGDERFSTHAVGDEGQLSIGREAHCDISIDDPSISRRHAILHLGPTPCIEDLGSVNGTRVRGQTIPVGERVPIALGEVVDVGTVMMILQHRAAPARPRRIWAHGYFEARLEEESLRAERAGASFAVVFAECEGSEAARQEEALSEVLRVGDVVGRYAPGTFEILLVDTSPHIAEQISQRLQARLSAICTRVEVGLACYPRDGRDPDSLAAAARAAIKRARGPVTPGGGSAAVEPAEAPMHHLQRLVERVARSPISVLIGGETGVGKEVMAETIHRLSPRRDRPFLRLNCAALSEPLLESELFGYERGAFTGATHPKMGLLESAQGGTVFLDEIGELPLSTQVKLLRVLEERQVLPVGAIKPRAIDVRFIAATNRDLEEEIARRTFRQDLYFRLNAVSLVIPPLRERVGEIEGLVQAFIARACREAGREPASLTIAPQALALLEGYAWPGNIRELRNVIERAVILADGEEMITADHLPIEKLVSSLPPPAPAAREPVPAPLPPEAAAEAVPPATPRAEAGADDGASAIERLRAAVVEEERRKVIEALNACAGNQTRAAAMLGIARRTLVKRLRALGIPRPRKG